MSRHAPEQPEQKSGFVHIVLVRHGERLDEADRAEWRRIRTAETRSDPPLTDSGWDQGRKAGVKVAEQFKQMRGKMALYSSPAVRCLSTAAAMAEPIGAKGVTPMYGLNCCAAAKERGVKCFPTAKPAASHLRGVKLEAWPPLGDAAKVDRNQSRAASKGGGFAPAVRDIAMRHQAGDVAVMVTHREGMWEFQCIVGARFSCGYCSTLLLHMDLQTGEFVTWGEARSPTPPRRHMSDPLQEALAQGEGPLVVQQAGDGMNLVDTPGVPHVFSGDPVRDGDPVMLLSTPQQAEGDCGAFVRVRAADGHEGWLPVQCVTMPP